MRGRSHLLPQDVYDVAYDVLNHRLVLSFDAVADGITVDDILVEVLTTVPAPRFGSSEGTMNATGPIAGGRVG
jgi:MoxR-like ATPase